MTKEKTPRPKSRLLQDMLDTLATWPGDRNLHKREEWGLRGVMRDLAACDLHVLEQLHLKACLWCFDAAVDYGAWACAREAWLMETWSWQMKLELWIINDGFPRPPEPPPRNRIREEALISHQALHLHLGLPLKPV